MFTLPLVTFQPSGRSLELAPGETLLAAVRRAGLPLGSSCDGDGVCGRCGVIILAGADALSPEGPLEARVKAANRVAASERLACLATVSGDVVVTARNW